MSELMAALEAILFAAGEPVPLEQLCRGTEYGEIAVQQALEQLAELLQGSGIRLIRMEDMYQLCSAKEYAEHVRRALETRKPPALGKTALEVLAVIAYRQPVTRSYIEQVRGVDSSYTVRSLLEKELIEECGHLDVPGRPVLLRTSPLFLKTFGLSMLSELPDLDETFGADAESSADASEPETPA